MRMIFSLRLLEVRLNICLSLFDVTAEYMDHVALRILHIILWRESRTAVRTLSMHTDDIDSSAEIAGTLINGDEDVLDELELPERPPEPELWLLPELPEWLPTL